MSKGLFITGTDTEVGKTWVTGRLCKAIRDKNYHCGVWKPVQSGFPLGSEQCDSAFLKVLSAVDDSAEEICQFTFEAALTPYIAAKLEDHELNLDDILMSSKNLRSKYDYLLVEGAGGVTAPITENHTCIDLICALNFPVLVVARPALGTINHSILTIDYLRRHGLEPIGIILNGFEKQEEWIKDIQEFNSSLTLESSHSSNPLMIERYAKLPVIGKIPYEVDKNNPVKIENYVDIDYIISQMEL